MPSATSFAVSMLSAFTVAAAECFAGFKLLNMLGLYASAVVVVDCGAIQVSKLKRLVYGSEAEAAVAIGFDDFIADGVRGTTVWQKPTVSIYAAAGDQGRRASEVFTNTAKKFKM